MNNKNNSDSSLISRYSLYSEAQSLADPELIHIEDIRSRAELFDWTINIHTHPKMFQLVYVNQGSVVVHLDGRESSHLAPCLITIPSSVVHGFQFDEKTTEGTVVTVSQLVVMEEHFRHSFPFSDELFGSAHILDFQTDDADTEFIAYIFQQMKQEYSNGEAGKKALFEWMLYSVLVKVGRRLKTTTLDSEKSGRYEQRYREFCQLVDKHYKEHQNNQFYADKLHTTPIGLNRACNAMADKNVNDILQDRLVLEAQRFLIYTSAPASLIAYDLGFKDPAYFSRFFKRRVGLTPGEFREQRDK